MFPSLGDQPKSDSQFFDDEAHFESDDSDEAPLTQTWQKIQAVAVRARGTSPFEVTSAALAQDVAMLR